MPNVVNRFLVAMHSIRTFYIHFPRLPTLAVADTVMVTSKHNEDKQYIWESNASEFSIAEDPRGDTLERGTTVSLFLKEEAQEFLEPNTLRSLVEKYSQFINFPIYIWESKVQCLVS